MYLKHRPTWLLGVGVIATHDLPLSLSAKTQNVDVSSLPDKPSLDMTWGYDHMIADMVIRGLELNHLWACNAPPDYNFPPY
jgi:hypothetical protein